MKTYILLFLMTLVGFTNSGFGQCNLTAGFTGDPAVTFNANSSADDPSYTWDFGDGSTLGFGAAPIHTYLANGSYTVTVYLADSVPPSTCFASTTLAVVITNAVGSTCDAEFTISDSGGVYYFSALNPIAGATYSWDFGDGNSSSGEFTNHVYSPGTYLICMTITAGTCTDTYCDSIIVGGSSGCSATYSMVDNDPVVSFSPIDPYSPMLFYLWDFGDGNSSSNYAPTHTYSSNGLYNATLTVWDSMGCSDTQTQQVSISLAGGSVCDAEFTVSDSGGVYFFSALNPIAGATYSWDFGDGNTSLLQNPTHTYSNPGAYVACLTLSASGCSDTKCDSIVINNTPIQNGNIFGQVMLSSAFADFGVVFLIEYDSAAGTLSALDTVSIDSNGYYGFTNVPYGDYLIKAALSPASNDYWNYSPTYFGDELLWSDASVVTLNSATYNASINMQNIANPGGPGFVSGSVLQGANKTYGVGDPISDILILLYDQNNDLVSYRYSDNAGAFMLDNLDYGTYTVYPDVPGLTTIAYTLVLSASSSSAGVSVYVNSTYVEVQSMVTGIDTPDATRIEAFPNPVSDRLVISLELDRAPNGSIMIHDMGGRIVYQYQGALQGNQEVDFSEFSPGIYLVKIQTGDTQEVIKIVK
jgi:PKD repeat protein